jgi:hypothetical protein
VAPLGFTSFFEVLSILDAEADKTQVLLARSRSPVVSQNISDGSGV